MRKPRSDKGKPRGQYKVKRSIAQTDKERDQTLRMPRSGVFDFETFYLAQRKSVSNEDVVRTAQEALDKSPQFFTRKGKAWKEPTPLSLKVRWETKGEFIQRQLLVAMQAQGLKHTDYGYQLNPEPTSVPTATHPAKPKHATLSEALQETGIVRVSKDADAFRLPEGMEPLARTTDDDYMYLAVTESMLEYTEDAIDWSPKK